MNALKHQLGLSILEVLVSLLILSVGILGLAQTQLMALHEMHRAYAETMAAQLAQNAVEETIIRTKPS